MGWYIFATIWCTSIGFIAGLCVGWFSTEEKLTEQKPLQPGFDGSIVRLRTIDLRPVSRN